MTKKMNVVLFYDNRGSADVLKLKSASIVDPENHN